MSAADRLASAMDVIDRRPRVVRRAAMTVVPLALLGALVTAFALAPRGDPHASRARHGRADAAEAIASPPVAPVRQGHPSATAAEVARRFLHGYLAYSYGRTALQEVRGAEPQLIKALRHERARVPPAARGRRPRITSVQVLEQARGAVQATATIADMTFTHSGTPSPSRDCPAGTFVTGINQTPSSTSSLYVNDVALPNTPVL